MDFCVEYLLGIENQWSVQKNERKDCITAYFEQSCCHRIQSQMIPVFTVVDQIVSPPNDQTDSAERNQNTEIYYKI